MALRAEQGGPIGGDDGNLSLGSSKVAGFVVEQQGLVQMKAMTKLALDDKLRRKGAVENKTFSPTVEIQTKKIEKWKFWKNKIKQQQTLKKKNKVKVKVVIWNDDFTFICEETVVRPDDIVFLKIKIKIWLGKDDFTFIVVSPDDDLTQI